MWSREWSVVESRDETVKYIIGDPYPDSKGGARILSVIPKSSPCHHGWRQLVRRILPQKEKFNPTCGNVFNVPVCTQISISSIFFLEKM